MLNIVTDLSRLYLREVVCALLEIQLQEHLMLSPIVVELFAINKRCFEGLSNLKGLSWAQQTL